MVLPLQNIRVLDLTRALAGPFCTMCLGDFGADVIKVESAPQGDMTRVWPPHDRGVSTYYLSTNRNKRGLAVNFRDPKGLALLRRIARDVDIVVENFKPGRADELGLGYDDLRRENPRLIYASITGFGRDGPYGDWPGFDQIAQGMSGLMGLTGYPDGDPTRIGIPVADITSGMWSAMGILAAVAQRHVTGVGQRVENSLLSSTVGLLSMQAQRFLSVGEIPGRTGNDHMVIYPYGTFEARDAGLNVAAATQDMWLALCGVLGLESLTTVPEFADNTKRLANRDALRELLNERFRTDTAIAWTRRLVEKGIPSGPIYALDQVFADPQVVHGGMVEEVAHATLGPIRLLSNPLRMDGFEEGKTVRLPPPEIGEHSRDILAAFGFTPGEIEGYVAEGVIGVRDGG
jgi:crotonobetainyl-CoA:carnitine CoA-transferase CaiB-like acyl-CoA transferase